MTQKFAFLTAHNIFSREANKENFDYIDQYNLSNELLKEYNCLIVTGYCDQEFLFEKRQVILDYLNEGKLVIFCGNLVTAWLPGASLFEAKEIKSFKDYEVQIPSPNAIYAGVEINDMVFNKGVAGFFARGHHKAPIGAEVLLTLGENRPATYIDRVSTNGTIFVHVGFNLFGYMSDGKTTDKIGPQLIQWCKEEVVALGHKDAPTRRRIGVIYSGSSHHMRTYKTGEFAKSISKIIPIRELATASFEDIDVLLIPSQTNMTLLLAHKQRIFDYENNGGIVVTFGHQSEEWLPNVTWELRPTNFWWWLEKNPKSGLVLTGGEHDLFKNYLTLEDATWHQHGVYWPKEGVETLVATDDGGSVLYIDKTDGKGVWINTTLDPDYHYGSYFMPATERFLRGFLPWLENGEI